MVAFLSVFVVYNHQTHRKSVGSTLFIKCLKDPFNSPLICFLGEVMMVILRALYLKRFLRRKLPRASPTSHPLNLYHYFSLYYIFEIKNNINILLVLSGASYSSPMKEILGCQTRKHYISGLWGIVRVSSLLTRIFQINDKVVENGHCYGNNNACETWNDEDW